MSLRDYTKPENLHPAELDRERAYHAQLAIEEIIEASEVDNGEAKSWLEKLPALIQTNGLGQALAFYKSRTNVAGARKIYEVVGLWLREQFGFAREVDVLVWITQEASPTQYRQAQAEVQAYLRWLKQLAKVHLQD